MYLDAQVKKTYKDKVEDQTAYVTQTVKVWQVLRKITEKAAEETIVSITETAFIQTH